MRTEDGLFDLSMWGSCCQIGTVSEGQTLTGEGCRMNERRQRAQKMPSRSFATNQSRENRC